jgi:molybdopterin-guanine dinucleotide biosynthesis protein
VDATAFSLEEILKRCKNVDLVFLEGFKRLVGKNLDLPKIVTVKSAKEAVKASKTFRPILAFTALHSIETLNLEAPYIDVLRDSEKMVDMVEKVARER